MTREQTKKALPILQAYAEGKTIQYKVGDNWKDITSKDWGYNPYCTYRIKPEKTYRPFKDVEECWQEMQNHKPFGWLKHKKEEFFLAHIETIDKFSDDNAIKGANLFIDGCWDDSETIFNNYTFLDGTPFGMEIEIKE